jgi:aspartate aminotransferase
MKISQRGHDIQASPIRKLKPYADAAKAKGVKVFHLNIGDPDIPAPQPVIDTFHGWSEPVLGYGPAQGFLELREAVTRYFAKYDIPLGPDEVLITTGGSEAIHFTFSVIGDVGDEIVIPEPYYTNYNGYASFAGLKIVPLPLASRMGSGFRPPRPSRPGSRPGPRPSCFAPRTIPRERSTRPRRSAASSPWSRSTTSSSSATRSTRSSSTTA